MNTLVDKVVEELKTLPYNCSGGSCSTPYCLSGVPGQQLLRFAGAIPLDDIQLMRQAIEEGCERVDTNECDTFDTNTNIIIALFAGDTAVRDISPERRKSLFSITKNLERIDEFAADSVVLECNTDTARRYGEIKHALRVKGHPIPENDIWIAAIALQHDMTLITRDTHFGEIENLKVATW